MTHDATLATRASPRPRRRTLEVELDGCGSLVRGYGSRELLERLTGRPPMWVSRQRGWSCQEHTARDLIALADDSFDIVITGPRSRKQRLFELLSASPPARMPEQPDQGRGLW